MPKHLSSSEYEDFVVKISCSDLD